MESHQSWHFVNQSSKGDHETRPHSHKDKRSCYSIHHRRTKKKREHEEIQVRPTDLTHQGDSSPFRCPPRASGWLTSVDRYFDSASRTFHQRNKTQQQKAKKKKRKEKRTKSAPTAEGTFTLKKRIKHDYEVTGRITQLPKTL